MFRILARAPGGSNALVQLHPSELTALLELAWLNRVKHTGAPVPTPGVGHPDRRSDTDGLLAAVVNPLLTRPAAAPFAAFIAAPPIVPAAHLGGWRWDHLIYAYMIENTRIYRDLPPGRARTASRRESGQRTPGYSAMVAQYGGAILPRFAAILCNGDGQSHPLGPSRVATERVPADVRNGFESWDG